VVRVGQVREKPLGRRVSTQRVDEIDGSTASQTVAFTIDHQRFEIDLSEANAAALRAVFAPYVAAGREVDAGRTGPRHHGTQNHGASKSASKTSVSRKSGPRKTTAPRKKPAPEEPARARTEPQHLASSSSTARSSGRSSPRTPSTARTASPTPETRTGAQALPYTTPEEKPDAPSAPAVPLQRRASVAIEVDVAAQRRRLMTGIGELLRVLAVATITHATNRVVTVVAKPKRGRHPKDHVRSATSPRASGSGWFSSRSDARAEDAETPQSSADEVGPYQV